MGREKKRIKMSVKFEKYQFSTDFIIFFSISAQCSLTKTENGDGEAKWDGDNHGGHWGPETAFITGDKCGETRERDCAGWSKSDKVYSKPFPIRIWYEFTSKHVPER